MRQRRWFTLAEAVDRLFMGGPAGPPQRPPQDHGLEAEAAELSTSRISRGASTTGGLR